ncbi:MAG: flagellin [Lachnospiraceae bacterium]|nr:flagellin [Lachnospiraceae bacterium]
MIVQHNMSALNTNRQLGATNSAVAKSTEKLSSGYRINRAGDDAAGLSISEKMRGQIRGLEQGSTNAQDGISLIQTAEGALNEVHSVLQRMRELAVQGSNDTNVTADREAIYQEMSQLAKEINRIACTTEFNTMKLFADEDLVGAIDDTNSEVDAAGGSEAAATVSLAALGDDAFANLQVGANSKQSIEFKMGSLNIEKITVPEPGDEDKEINLKETLNSLKEAIASTDDFSASHTAFTASIRDIDAAVTNVSKSRSYLGAIQNRLEHTISNADNTAENLQSAESRIRDVNMAEEMVNFSKNNILQQAGQSMLAQANQSTQGVLSLLR